MAGQLWSVDSLGGYMYSDQLSDTLRTSLQPNTRFRNFCDIEDAHGKGNGETFSWNVYEDVVTEGGTLNEEDAMPETNFTIRQESMTITEYGNSVPYTSKAQLLSKHSMERVVTKVLKNDACKVLDKAAHAEFNKTKLVVTPATATDAVDILLNTDGTAGAVTNNIGMSKEHVKRIADQMAERNITPFDGDNYMALGRPTTFRDFKDDLEAISIYVDAGFSKIAAGEIGRYEGIRFFTQTNVASEGWTNSKSDAAYFFGADTVTEGVVVPEEVRAKLPGDYGRSKGVAWVYVGGFGICHTKADHSRIIKWGSVA